MVYLEVQHKVALVSCVELVLMRRGNTNYHLVLAKLGSLYNCTIMDCYENPEYLRTVLKDVYKEDYNSIIDEIKLELDELVNMEKIVDFFKIMES
jgi:hypothetical protein